MSDLIDRIEGIIKERGTNFKRVECECGLGNGTIKRWNEQSPRLDKLILVSEYLQVSLDYLVFGRSHSETQVDKCQLDLKQVKEDLGLICDGNPLSNEEADLVAMYRLLPSNVQEDMFEQVFCLYRKYAELKRESFYWTYGEDEKNGPAGDHEAQGGTA